MRPGRLEKENGTVAQFTGRVDCGPKCGVDSSWQSEIPYQAGISADAVTCDTLEWDALLKVCERPRRGLCRFDNKDQIIFDGLSWRDISGRFVIGPARCAMRTGTRGERLA
ncbi:hypothetical protein GCM10022221_79930 [Actinocorallia aurea]